MNDIQTLANIAGMTAELIESGKLVFVIRCKDCKHGEQSIVPCSSNYYCHRNEDVHKPDWFCADGDRKSD